MKGLIYAECKPDKTLIETILGNVDVIHSYGKSRVIERLSKSRKECIGMIDEDPNKSMPNRFKTEFVLIHDHQEFKIKVFKHLNKDAYLVMLCPRLEEWIIEACRETNISPSLFNLPNDPEKLHRIININTRNLVRLINYLIDRSERLQKLREILNMPTSKV